MTMASDGVAQQAADGTYELRFERMFPYPVERVWAALTERDQLGSWLADGEIGGEAGQEFRLTFDLTSGDELKSRIIRAEAPRLLEFTWRFGDERESIVRWELEPHPSGTRFLLTHSGLSDGVGDTLPGWHAHLEILEAVLTGEPDAWDDGRFNALKERYAGARAG